MLASSRSMPDFAAAAAALQFVTDAELAEKAALPGRRSDAQVAAFIAAGLRAHPAKAGVPGIARQASGVRTFTMLRSASTLRRATP